MRQRLTNLLIVAVITLLGAGSSLGATDLEEDLKRLEALRDTGDFELILTELEALHAEYPAHAGILWRMARTRTDVAERVEDSDRQQTLLLQAFDEAATAITLAPESSHAHLTKSVCAGRLALVEGTRRQVELSRDMRTHADRAIALDETNDLAYHVRGRWHYEIASLGWAARTIVRLVYGGLPDASFAQAEADYRQAIALEDRVVHRYELGRVLQEKGRTEEAKEQYRKAIAMPFGDVTDVIYKERAHRLLIRM